MKIAPPPLRSVVCHHGDWHSRVKTDTVSGRTSGTRFQNKAPERTTVFDGDTKGQWKACGMFREDDAVNECVCLFPVCQWCHFICRYSTQISQNVLLMQRDITHEGLFDTQNVSRTHLAVHYIEKVLLNYTIDSVTCNAFYRLPTTTCHDVIIIVFI